ncbi:MAG TPA: RidA family protein [Fimbriimonadaceae bacterium]
MRQRYSTNTKWEPIVGYSRAIRAGNFVSVSGTTATDENGEVVGDNAYDQTVQVLKNIQRALGAVGAEFSDVIRTRTYVIDIDRDWEMVGKAHGEIFGTIRPATSMIQISKLISPEMLVEIEVDAYIEEV